MAGSQKKVVIILLLPLTVLLMYELWGSIDQRLPSILSSAKQQNAQKQLVLQPMKTPVPRTPPPTPTRPTIAPAPVLTTTPTPGETKPRLNEKGQPFDAVWVTASGTFQEKLHIYNDAIANERQIMLNQIKDTQWKNVESTLNVLWCNKDDALLELTKFPQVKTIALKWDANKTANHNTSSTTTKATCLNSPLCTTFKWTGSRSMCYLIETPTYTKARWDAVYGRKCTTNMNNTEVEIELEPVYYHGKPINKNHYWPNDGLSYPSYFYHSYPGQILYVHAILNGVITGLGDVISGDLKLVPYSCSQDLDPRQPTNYINTPLYDEVFVITQYWAESFFHKMLESFPRISPYLTFLQKHPNIKIHVRETGGYTKQTLEFLSFNSSRFVTDVCRAKIVYLPQATPCGFVQAQSAQYLSFLYRRKIKETYPDLSRRNIVLIKRSGTRRLTHHADIQTALENLATEFNLTFKLFSDSPVPGFDDAMQIFNGAVLVVGPHGAGLSNVIYSLPGTYVIEGVCNPPHVNMCFQWSAHVLGHHYHGIPSRRGCESVIDIDPNEVETAARMFLNFAVKRLSL